MKADFGNHRHAIQETLDWVAVDVVVVGGNPALLNERFVQK
jgi:hypothetical protein